MVGHTGVIPAAVRAIETADECLGEVIAAVHERGGVCLVTADHGNADHMLEPDGSPNTAALDEPGARDPHEHRSARCDRTAGSSPTWRRRCSRRSGIEQPAQMTGRSLIEGR